MGGWTPRATLRSRLACAWCVALVLAALQSTAADGGGKGDSSTFKWLKSADVDQNHWRRQETNFVAGALDYEELDDSDDKPKREDNDDEEKDSKYEGSDDCCPIVLTKVDIFSDEELPPELIRVNPGVMRNFCRVNIQGAVAGDTNATTRWEIASAYVSCDGPDKVKMKIHPALGKFIKEWSGVRIVKNNFDELASALVTFVGPQNVAIYNSTVLFLRDVDEDLAFIKLEKGVNATMTRMNFFNNTGGLAPVLIDNSAVLLGSVGFVHNYSPKFAGGIYARNNAQVTASNCQWDHNGRPNSLPYAGAMFVNDNSQFILSGGGMTNNFGQLAGAVLVGDESSIIIDGVHMANNTGLGSGTVDVSGALWIRNSNASVNGSALDGNKADMGAGAIRATGDSYVRVTYSQINENQSDDDGGTAVVSNAAGKGDAFDEFGNGKATLKIKYSGVKGNWGGGIRCKAGGRLEVVGTTVGDNVDGWAEKYNMDTKECEKMDTEDLQVKNTGYIPLMKDVAKAGSEDELGSFSESFLDALRSPSPALLSLEELPPDGQAPFVFVPPPPQSATVDTWDLAQQLGAVSSEAAAFNQFEQLNSLVSTAGR